jgi:carboxymethylenebutenolidase
MDVTLPTGTPAYIARSEGAQRGLVIIPDIWGLRPLFTDMCDDLAARTGWSVGCFEPFSGRDLPDAEGPDALAARFAVMPDMSDRAVLGDAVATADEIGIERCGLIGFCMGGMYAYKAAFLERFDRIASFYGMIHVPEEWRGPEQGEPLAAIAARGTTAVMAIVGGIDPYTPAGHIRELRDAGVDVVEFVSADHGFVHDPNRPAHRPDDAAEAWERALTFLAG